MSSKQLLLALILSFRKEKGKLLGIPFFCGISYPSILNTPDSHDKK